jgi:methyl-accepting chemotaxis protein
LPVAIQRSDFSFQEAMVYSKRFWGFAFVIAGSVGALFVIYGIVQVWRARSAGEKIVAETMVVAIDTIQATEEGLDVIQGLVERTSGDVMLLESSIQTLTLTIDNSNLVLGSLSALTGTDLPATIIATQASLTSAQTSAALIDDVLGAMAGIPLLGLGAYQPEVPLSTALGEISESLDPINPSLESISDNLAGTSLNLEALGSELGRVTETTREISATLAGAREVIADYQTIAQDLSVRAERIQEQAPATLRGLAWLLTFLLLALLFPQIGLAERGLGLLQESERETTEPNLESEINGG